jgi:hypothetical protein
MKKRRNEKMVKYKVTFEAYVRLEAENASKAIELAWLQKNLDLATYRYKDVKREKVEK